MASPSRSSMRLLLIGAVLAAPACSGGALGGSPGTGGGGGGGGMSCPASVDFRDGTTGGLALGPHNHVFLNPMVVPGPVQNYADQTVFPGPAMSVLANFSVAPPEALTLDPSSGTALDPWLGELSLIPTGCNPSSLAGLTVRVRLLWTGLGAGAPQGIYLGSYANGLPVAHADASVISSGTEPRAVNTLNPIELTHTFTDNDDGAFLRAYLFNKDGEVPTTLYIDSVTWTGGSTGTGGRAGSEGTGGATGTCPATVTFTNGTVSDLALGPHNHTFASPAVVPGPVTNYADQTIFPGPALSVLANFSKAPSSALDVTPMSGTALDPWLGELSLIPAGCQPASLDGRTVRVRLLWRLNGAIGTVPGHGIFLGSYASGAPVAYADAALASPNAATDDSTRTLNSLNPIEVTHTFTAGEDNAWLRMYLVGSEGEIPTTVYIESITWSGGS